MDAIFPTVVIDHGSDTLKTGFSDDEVPQLFVPPIVGCPYKIAETDEAKEFYIGQEAKDKYCRRRQAVECGHIIKYEEMEMLWKYIFNQLKISPENHSIILSEPTLNPRSYRETMTQIMFEIFEFKSVYVASQPVLSLLASGRITGMVLDSGKENTQVVPVYEGFSLPRCIPRFDVSGQDVDYALSDALKLRGLDLRQMKVRQMKEKLCYISLDYENENPTEEIYLLPDGNSINVGKERFAAPEILFNPELTGREIAGVQHSINRSINICDTAIRKNLYENIVIAGGNTTFPGFRERLEKEMKNLVSSEQKIEVVGTPNHLLSCFTGGTILASLSTFKEISISKAEYNEFGPSMVGKKCF